MSNNLKVYLAGSVPKSNKEIQEFKNWRLDYESVLAKLGCECIDPFQREMREGDPLFVLGTDCKRIKECDLVLVNAETKLGAGTSMEFVIAKYFSKTVVTILPKDSVHRKSNVEFGNEIIEDWVHPFVASFSDMILESIEEFPENFDEILKIDAKGISLIDESIRYVE